MDRPFVLAVEGCTAPCPMCPVPQPHPRKAVVDGAQCTGRSKSAASWRATIDHNRLRKKSVERSIAEPGKQNAAQVAAPGLESVHLPPSAHT
eukprot:229897-Chlamydomonas_euryale.AAC.6